MMENTKYFIIYIIIISLRMQTPRENHVLYISTFE